MKFLRHIFIALVTVAGVPVAGFATAAEPAADTVVLIEGVQLLRDKQYDLARERLSRGALSDNIYIRAESNLYLNALEMELENYDEALIYLERYHSDAMKLLWRAAAAEEQMRIHKEETIRSIASLKWIVVGGVCIVVVVVVSAVYGRRRVRPHLQAGRPVIPDAAAWESCLAEAETFKQTPVYAEIARLAAQNPGREARVLSHSRQEALNGVLAETFDGFAATLREVCPALTAGDVKLCCLSLTGLSSFGRALCFGSTETNIIKQRKHKIKRKLASDDTGRELFEFIFSPRDQIPHL